MKKGGAYRSESYGEQRVKMNGFARSAGKAARGQYTLDLNVGHGGEEVPISGQPLFRSTITPRGLAAAPRRIEPAGKKASDRRLKGLTLKLVRESSKLLRWKSGPLAKGRVGGLIS